MNALMDRRSCLSVIVGLGMALPGCQDEQPMGDSGAGGNGGAGPGSEAQLSAILSAYFPGSKLDGARRLGDRWLADLAAGARAEASPTARNVLLTVIDDPSDVAGSVQELRAEVQSQLVDEVMSNVFGWQLAELEVQLCIAAATLA